MNKELNQEQVKQLEQKLKDMSPEEIQEMIKKQCLFCNILNGNIESKKIYEDDKVMALLDIHPAVRGHTLLFPKKHFQVMNQVPDDIVAHLFKVANKISSVLFELLKADGTSIYVGNGQIAGQNVPHAVVHIIPRFNDDKVTIGWQGTKLSEKDMEGLQLDLEKLLKNISFEKKEEKIATKKPEKIVRYNEERIP